MKIFSAFTFLILASLLSAQSDKDYVSETVSQAIIKSHIGFLASDALKGRDTPSPELKIAAEYIKSRFVQYGVTTAPGMDSYFQPVTMQTVMLPTEGSVTVGDNSFENKKDFIALTGLDANISAKTIYVGYGNEEDLKGKKVEGRIVITLCGDGTSTGVGGWLRKSIGKRQRLKAAGAVAIIELYRSPQVPWDLLVGYLSKGKVELSNDVDPIPHIWMNRPEDDQASFQKKNQKGKLSLSGGSEEAFITQNVVGYVEGSDENLKNEVVVYSAHYDHVGVGSPDETGDDIYNGARDNAVGTVTVLSAAENIAKYPTRRSAMFILFTGEEKGLLGSEYFVNNSPVSLEQIVFCFNSDNAGTNSSSIATIIGLERTTAEDMIIQSCNAFGLEAAGDPAPEENLFDRSDNVRFASKGIPAPSFGMGITAFDDEIKKYYHRPGDEPETLDYAYLEKFFSAYVLSCRVIANADEAPFWLEGDKYYQIGVDLYAK